MRSPTKALIVRYLQDEGPQTSDGLAALLGVSRRTINAALAELMAGQPPLRRVHIGRWVRQYRHKVGSVPRAEYVAGPGRNAARPLPRNAVERSQQSRIRRNSPERLLAVKRRTSGSPTAHEPIEAAR
jgi:hypothetical protein